MLTNALRNENSLPLSLSYNNNKVHRLPLANAKFSKSEYGPEEKDDFVVFVKHLRKKWTFNAKKSDLIHALKLQIEQTQNIAIENQCLFLKDRQLIDQQAISYYIKPKSTIKLLLRSCHQFNQMQACVINGMKRCAKAIRDQMKLDTISVYQKVNAVKLKLHNIDKLSGLILDCAIMINNTRTKSQVHEIMFRNKKIYAQFLEDMKTVRQKMNTSDENKRFDIIAGNKKCWEDMDNIQAEIKQINEEIFVLEQESNALKQLVKKKESLLNSNSTEYKHRYASIKDKYAFALDEKWEEVEGVYRRCSGCIQKADHATKIRAIVEKKREALEKQYKSWKTDDVIEWVKSVENGYFGEERFDNFVNALEEMKVEGEELHEMNNKLFLRTSAGLNEEEDQNILIKHIERICYQNICSLCKQNRIDSVFVPCGHCCYCHDCSTKINSKKCTICNMNVVQIIKLINPEI